MREAPRKRGLPKKDPALEWDKQTLSEEQTLVQPLYDRMSPKSFGQLQSCLPTKNMDTRER